MPTVVTSLIKYFSDKRKNKILNRKETYRQVHKYMFKVLKSIESNKHNNFLFMDFKQFDILEEDCNSLLLLNGTDEMNDRFKRFVKNYKEIEKNQMLEYDKFINNMNGLYLDACRIIRKSLKDKIDVK